MPLNHEYSLIKQVLDKYFDFMDEIGGNQYPTEFIPEILLDKNRKLDEEYSYWIPIKSSVSENDIIELEALFRHRLPASFLYFLCERHFVEVQLGSYAINFFSNFPGELTSKFKEIINQLYWTLLERNYLPIAHVMDYGVLCFDANADVFDNNYPLVILDHESDYTQPEFYTRNFLNMFHEFNSHLDGWIKNNREKRKV